jgi:SAM-dependent methyltransferase
MARGELLLDDEAATRLANSGNIIWYQRYHLSPNVITPGVADIEAMLETLDLPQDLTGRSVLDIGTTNGGAAFIAERRGADRVVAVDIYDPHDYGFAQVAEAIGSRAEFHRASIYELPLVLRERFDIVLFLGVLYHLRHPLLAIDSLRALTRDRLFVETVVTASDPSVSHSEFYAGSGPQVNDTTIWFVPSVRCVIDWLNTSGFKAQLISAWPKELPRRAAFSARASGDAPHWRKVSYEKPLKVAVAVD